MLGKGQSFGAVVRTAREARGLTLAECAKLFEISITYISDMEHGRRKPPADLELIKRMERSLKLEPGQLKSLAEVERRKIQMPPDVMGILGRQPEIAVQLLREADEAGMEDVLAKLRQYLKHEES